RAPERRVSSVRPSVEGSSVSGSSDSRAWPPGPAAAARRGVPPAASAPALYPLFSRLDRVLLPSMPLQQQEAVGQHHQSRVVVEPAPGPPLEVVHAQLLLHLLIPLLHRPAALPQTHRLPHAGPGRQIAQGVLDLAVLLLLDQQPHRTLARALACLPARRRPDAQPGEPPRQPRLRPLPPGHTTQPG